MYQNEIDVKYDCFKSSYRTSEATKGLVSKHHTKTHILFKMFLSRALRACDHPYLYGKGGRFVSLWETLGKKLRNVSVWHVMSCQLTFTRRRELNIQ